MTERIFQFVGKDRYHSFTVYEDGEIESSLNARGYQIVKYNSNPRQREELQGMPIVDGYVGPMYGSTDEYGIVTLRYETKKEYATYD